MVLGIKAKIFLASQAVFTTLFVLGLYFKLLTPQYFWAAVLVAELVFMAGFLFFIHNIKKLPA